VPEDAIRQVLRFDKSKQRQHHSDIARAVGVSEATVSRILSGRIQPTDNAELLERYKQVAAAARIEGARRFKIGWVSGPTLRELNRKYLWHRRRRWGR
jgi:transcriptional regulator with XRE-family HTH domain